MIPSWLICGRSMVGNKIKVLLDTNILVDVLCEHDRLSTPASAVIIQAIRDGKLEGALTTQSIVDASYILSRMPGFSDGTFRNGILKIMNFVNIEYIHYFDIRDAILQPGRDFEDDVHYAHAISESCDMIITSDAEFRKNRNTAELPVLSPEEFVEKIRPAKSF